MAKVIMELMLMSEQAIFKDDIVNSVRKPKMYKVILLNDDYTTMEFVIKILVSVFHKNPSEAARIMLDVHQKGKGTVGVYTYDIAATKVARVEALAVENGYPLKAGMEEE